jgi:hypothetical protein
MVSQPPSSALSYLTDAHMAGVCPRLEDFPGPVLLPLMLTALGWGKNRAGSLQAGSNARGGVLRPSGPPP